ncbi:MAG TPA: ATP-binding protein [Thermoanaerobaculia bacterium]|jgi:PAS domain S-box-containing protein|nr:ATP-binding protein [Thermoanaerobaculia bacterium]
MARQTKSDARDWLRLGLESLGDAVITTDSAGRITYLNAAAERLTGASAESGRGRHLNQVLRLVDEGTGRPVELLISEEGIGEAAATVRRPLRVQGGAGWSVQASLDPIREGQVFAGAVLVLRDAGDRLEQEKEVRESVSRYRTFFEQSAEGIWRCELEEPVPVELPAEEQVDRFYRDAFLAECNRGMARMYGLSEPAELIGARLGDLLPRSDNHNVEYLRSFVRSGYRLAGAESHELDREGKAKYFLNNLIGVLENGRLVRVWGTQLDITERKRLEDELRRRAEDLAGADRRKDQFLAMLAHELRNPLAPIRNAVELMRQVETIDPAFQPSREMVERQVKHLARLVDDLLDVSRITQGSIRLRKEVVELGTVVERAIEATRPLIDSRAHDLKIQLPTDQIHLEADPTRLEQILTNLLNNAAKYTMPGGQIRVTAALEGDEAVVRVRDNGIGVPPDVLDRVFEPFVQSEGSLARSEGGLGIGLTLVRSLVEMHGGTVEATSPGLGQGSEFVVRLPATVPAEKTASLPEADAPFPSRGLRVLVVEDNVDAAESLAALLHLWGHEVRMVHDGLAAIDAAREHHPEVVLLDIGLPGLDGYQVAKRLREDASMDGALLVAMTGYGQPEDRRRSREAGIHHHFVKPVEPFVLRTLLSNLGAPVASEPY